MVGHFLMVFSTDLTVFNNITCVPKSIDPEFSVIFSKKIDFFKNQFSRSNFDAWKLNFDAGMHGLGQFLMVFSMHLTVFNNLSCVPKSIELEFSAIFSKKIENFGANLGWFGGDFGTVWGYFRSDFGPTLKN